MTREADLTDLANARPGPHTMRNKVGTWVDADGQVSGSAGGYFLTATLSVDPGTAPREVLAALSLFQGSVKADTVLEPLPFDLPEGTTRTRLEYRATGHGGASDNTGDCIGHADEFCKRTHHLSVDGIDVIPPEQGGPTFVPWRTDCADFCTETPGHPFGQSYCLENPNGALSSVRAPRANWCPGDHVPPIAGPLPEAASSPGPHTLDFAIDQIAPDGGSWPVSITLYAYGD
jgi:hypothetical protein